jgi:hypothetical protein
MKAQLLKMSAVLKGIIEVSASAIGFSVAKDQIELPGLSP